MHNAHSLLPSVFKDAVTREHTARKVARGVPIPKDDVENEKEIFTRDEWARFYEVMEDHYKVFTAYLPVTGCRIAEATAVRVYDLDT